MGLTGICIADWDTNCDTNHCMPQLDHALEMFEYGTALRDDDALSQVDLI